MAHPTGTFSFAEAGQLRVYLSARWTTNVGDFGNPDEELGNVRIRAYVGPTGTLTYTSVIDKFTQSTFIDLDYPGGSVSWNVGTETVEYTVPGPTKVIALADIRVAWELVKK